MRIPCALASELEATSVDFTTHVIGFDIRKADAPQLACLVTNAGGKFISASNAVEDTFTLPAGDYIFGVRNAGQMHNTAITLKPGQAKR